jgi:hypothetical protein
MDAWCRSRDSKYAELDAFEDRQFTYQNPVSNGTPLRIEFDQEFPEAIVLTDLEGRNLNMEWNRVENTGILNTQSLSIGNYLVIFSYPNSQVVRKLQVN